MRNRIWWFLVYVIGALPIGIGYGQTFHTFHLGNHTVEETTVLFEFPDESVTNLYAFNFSVYPALSKERNQALIKLYNRDKNMLAEGKSICLNSNRATHFGSVVFSSITRANVDQSAFFTLETIPCQNGKNRLSAEEDPRLQPLSDAVQKIAEIFFPCMQTGESETVCICVNRDALKEPVGKAASFLRDHPELQGKELAFYKSTTSSDNNSESLILTMPLKEVDSYLDKLNRCE